MTRRRLDAELVRRGLAGTADEARTAVLAGRVTVAGRPFNTPATLVAPEEPLVIREVEGEPFVSRGAWKLDAGLTRFGIDPAGRDALDAGASTGGFTDRLLRGGARRVISVDVGYGQLAWKLRTDDRVVVLERTNVRNLRPADLPFQPDLIVADLSFASLTGFVSAFAILAAPGADLLLLVKPQFEVDTQDVGRGGVVEDPSLWRKAIARVATAMRGRGVQPAGLIVSPLLGPAGNAEFVLHARAVPGDAGASVPGLEEAIAEAEGLRG